MVGSDEDGEFLLRRVKELEASLADVRRELVRKESAPLNVDRAEELLLCGLGKELGAIRLEHVNEVVPVAKLIEVPESAPWIAGVLDLRGVLVPVVDLHRRLKGVERDVLLEDTIVICLHEGRCVGLLVAGVPRLRTAPPGTLKPTPPETATASYVSAVLREDETTAVLLELPQLFGASELPRASP